MARFNLPLSADFESSIAGSDDDVITIMLLYCKEFGLTSETLQPRLLGEMQQTASLANSERWLLAYECERRGWASQPEISSDPYFEQLLKRGVDFLRNPQMPVPEVARNKLDIAQPTQRSTPPESPTQVPSPGPLLSSWLLDYDDLSPVDPGQEIPPADGETEDADYPD